MTGPRAGPPRWAETLVRRATLGAPGGHSAVGDLWVEWKQRLLERGPRAARTWYVGQAVRIGGRYLLARGAAVVAAVPGAVLADVRQAMRGLRSAPGFALVSVLSLGGGLGLTTAIFSLVNALWLAPLPWPAAERLVDIDETHPREVCSGCSVGASYASYLAWRADAGLEAVGALDELQVVLTGAEGADRVVASAISDEVPALLGAETQVGRLFTATEHSVGGGAGVVVLTHGLWTRRFGADPSVVGSTLTVDGVPRDIVGVLSARTRLPSRADVVLPLAAIRTGSGADERGLWVVGRLPGGVAPRAVEERLAEVSRRWILADPGIDRDWGVRVQPLRASLAGQDVDPALAALFVAATGLVLLIASLNLASLLLARVTGRDHELKVRAALGSGSWRLARLVLSEAGLLAAAAALLALLTTSVALGVIDAAGGYALPAWVELRVDRRVWAAGFGTAALAVLLCSLAPALRAARGGRRGLVPGSAGPHRDPAVIRRQRLLLGAQVAVGLALLASTALSMRMMRLITDFSTLGQRIDGVGGVLVALGGERYARPGERWVTIQGVTAAMRAHPGVTTAAAEARAFIGSWGAADGPSPMRIEGRAEAVPDRVVPRHSLAVTPGFFEIFEIPIVRGRGIEERDLPGGPGVAVVSVEAARALWPDEDPLGARFTLDNGLVEGPLTVVGVVADVVANPLSESRRPLPRIYFALSQTEVTDVRFRPAFAGAPPPPSTWRDIVAGVDPWLPIEEVTTMRAEMRRWITPFVVMTSVLLFLGAVALLLLALGVFGTLSYQVAASSDEVGIRRALGAGTGAIVRDTAVGIVRVLAAGLAGGCVLAVIAATALDAGRLQIGATEPWALAAGACAVLAAAALAAQGPLRRAVRIDPMRAIRRD